MPYSMGRNTFMFKENGSCGMELDLSRSCQICSDQHGKACEVDHMVYYLVCSYCR